LLSLYSIKKNADISAKYYNTKWNPFLVQNIKNLEINLHLFTKENGNIFDIIIAVYKKSDGEIPIKFKIEQVFV